MLCFTHPAFDPRTSRDFLESPASDMGLRGPCPARRDSQPSPASAMATARNTARPLFMVSSHSLRGIES